ncbi:hypothetical protein PpBr36_07369 [Pyricularia pennisetigena]|uniref:hypothetical protein n=1 Tax=Pyricularia pennisetigena TaxID=1578925 RepID=UPI001152A6EF|nr:hypothetical protein PpBr36_07369 [Pyricularia pennisetigena]TLS25834.1 hypothetical protein PpBr36_07369 [Pyricularia pennisetigena]
MSMWVGGDLAAKGTSAPSKQELIPTVPSKPDVVSSCVLLVEPDSGFPPLFTLAPPRTPNVSHVKQSAANTLSKPFRYGATISGLFFKSGGSCSPDKSYCTIKLSTYKGTFDRADVMQGISSLTATLGRGGYPSIQMDKTTGQSNIATLIKPRWEERVQKE